MWILLLSFFAWVLTVLAPCILPLLPVILWASIDDNRNKLRPYIIIISLSFSIIVFSLLLKTTTIFIWFNKSILTTFSGLIIIFFWIITLFPNLWKNFSNKIWFSNKSNQNLGKISQKKWIIWDILIWFALWPVFSSCSPTYAIILAVILPISVVFWLVNLFAYVFWLASILLLISILWQRFSKKLIWISKPKSVFKKILWIMFLIIWLTILTSFDKKIETYLIWKWFTGYSNLEQDFLDNFNKDIENLNFNYKIMNDKEIKDNGYSIAYFAWWCFWCLENVMEAQEWVIEAISWYSWWEENNPDYKLVSSWKTWYRETVKVIYDSNKISYSDLVYLFWKQIDPADDKWQFADRWFQYTTAIFYNNQNEKNIAENSKETLLKSWYFKKNIVTKIEKYNNFFKAEEYHQDYAKKQSKNYKKYRKGSGRKDYLNKIWKIKSKDLKVKLTALQYKVTQNNWTEKPFDNKYWDNKEIWIYVDIIDGTPLFSSLDKYVSWTGWPSFTKPIDELLIKKKEDKKFFITRVEVKWFNSDSHLWHVFNDWPRDKWWLRYCLNSASLKFISFSDLEKEWYWEYKKIFE